MKQVVIENPILSSPFEQPRRHFRARLDDGHGRDNPLKFIVEVTGERDKDKVATADTARTLWVPAVNNHGGFGRWAFVEIVDPWDAKNLLHSFFDGSGR